MLGGRSHRVGCAGARWCLGRRGCVDLMNEGHFFAVSLAGMALLLIGWLWVTKVAWRHGSAWGLGVLLFPPAGLLFAIRHLGNFCKTGGSRG